jgi:hypothetical protein
LKYAVAYILSTSILLFVQGAFAQELHVGDISGPNITHVSLDDTLKLYPGGTVAYALDIDQDDEPDIRFTIRHAIGGMSTHIWQMAESLNTVEFACDTSDINADTLIYMSLINHGLNWIIRSGGVRLYEEFYSQAPPPWGPPSYKKGLFRKADHYLGFRKLSYNDTIYGWINIDASVSRLVFHDFAVFRTSYGLKEIEKSGKINIYPNPTSDILYIELPGHEARDTKLEIINISGEVLKSFAPQDLSHRGETISIDMSDFPAGLYFIKYESVERTITGKLIRR